MSKYQVLDDHDNCISRQLTHFTVYSEKRAGFFRRTVMTLGADPRY